MRSLDALVSTLLAVSTLALGSCLSSTTSEPDQVGQTTSATKNVGAGGDKLAVAGATLTIPQGTFAGPVDVTVSTTTGEGGPVGYMMLSSIFHCDPSATTLFKPVTLTIPYRNDGLAVTVFWSGAANPDYVDLGGTANPDGTVTTTLSHFGQGFVGRKR
jgi:hypothetical protein